MVFFAMLTSILVLFLYCFFGKIATEANWQGLSIDLQKYIIFMIQNAQRPHYYHEFDVAVLDLDTFTRVIFEQSMKNMNFICE